MMNPRNLVHLLLSAGLAAGCQSEIADSGAMDPGSEESEPADLDADDPDATITAAGAPAGIISAAALSGTDVIVQWKDVTSDESAFIVERKTAPAGAWIRVARPPANTQLFRDTGLTPGTEYRYQVLVRLQDQVHVVGQSATVKTDRAGQPSTFFVSPAGAAGNPGTEARPWPTLQYAHDRLAPGQTVMVRSGDYASTNYAVLAITRSGTPNAWITYRNYPGERPKVVSTIRKNWSGIEVRHASYIIVDGFELAGHSKQVNLQEALAEMRTPTAYASSSGISVESRDVTKPISHHVIVRNNYVHDQPLVGIAALGTDYVTVENNQLYANGRFSSYGGSGISFLSPRDSDTNTSSYKLIVRGNVSSDNLNEVPCGCYGYVQPTDGNGIILDTYTTSDYKGRTLVTNNLVVNNGARGIHVFHASNVDVFFNTTYRNSTIAITGEGEITAIHSRNVRVRDNIMVARADRPVNSTRNSENVDYSHNLVAGGNGFVSTGSNTNRLGTDPRFVGGGGNSAWKLRSDSPAVDRASGTAPVPSGDLFQAPRPQGVAADVGAIESH